MTKHLAALPVSSMQPDIELMETLLEACRLRHRPAVGHILNTLSSQMPLKACSYYSASPLDNTLTLVAQTGLAYETYSSYHLPTTTPAGRAFLQDAVLSIPNVTDCPDYRDGALIKQFGLKEALFLPLHFPDSIREVANAGQVSGVLCAYTEDGSLEAATQLLVRLEGFLSKLIFHSVTHSKQLVRGDIVNEAIASKDLNSFLHRTIRVLQETWSFGAASVFLNDRRSSLLRLHASVPGVVRPGDHGDATKFDTYYTRQERENETVSLYLDQSRSFQILHNEQGDAKYPDDVPVRRATAWLTISYPPLRHTPQIRRIGILRVTNKVFSYGTKEELGKFVWEDYVILQFVAEVIGIIAFLKEESERGTTVLERTLHGIKTFIDAALRSLNQLQDRGGLSNRLPSTYRFHIPDAIAHMEATRFQFDQAFAFERGISVQERKVLLYGEVLAKVVGIAHKCKRVFNIRELEITQLDDAGFGDLPAVWGDDNLLILVFRNLMENAMKYSRERGICKIKISYKDVNRDFVEIWLSDDGIPIPEEDRPWLFVEGFRGDLAMRRSTTGTGIGLSQACLYVKEIGGDLYLTESHTFVVRLKKWH